MSYCTVDDVVHEFTPTLRVQMERDYGEAFQKNLEGHIAKAEAFVNASLSRAYSVPLKAATSTVISAECKIAAYFAAIAYSEKDETAKTILDYLVAADSPVLVDEGLPEDEQDTSGVLYGSDNQYYTSDELDLW